MALKIFWLTSENLFDVDLPVVSELAKRHNIDWHIHISHKPAYFTRPRIEQAVAHLSGSVNVTIFQTAHRARSLHNLRTFFGYARRIRRGNYDVIYADMLGEPYLFFALKAMGLSRTIYACHDFIDHINFPNAKIIARYKKFIFRNFRNFQFFSRSQHSLFLNTYSGKQSFHAPLCLKDFGPSDATPSPDIVRFTFFGHIRHNKGLSLLIEAGNILAERGIKNFRINIHGFSETWQQTYAPLITRPEVFNLDIRHATNEEIPDIISSAHYMVLPYLDVTQSGPMLIAYNYAVPVIGSDHPGFREMIEHGVNGYLFQNNSATDLADKMQTAIANHASYPTLRQNLRDFIDRQLNTAVIARSYESFFNRIAK